MRHVLSPVAARLARVTDRTMERWRTRYPHLDAGRRPGCAERYGLIDLDALEQLLGAHYSAAQIRDAHVRHEADLEERRAARARRMRANGLAANLLLESEPVQ